VPPDALGKLLHLIQVEKPTHQHPATEGVHSSAPRSGILQVPKLSRSSAFKGRNHFSARHVSEGPYAGIPLIQVYCALSCFRQAPSATSLPKAGSFASEGSRIFVGGGQGPSQLLAADSRRHTEDLGFGHARMSPLPRLHPFRSHYSSNSF